MQDEKMNRPCNPRVGANAVASIELLYHLPILEQDCLNLAGVPTIRTDVEEFVGGFGPLKSLLKAISTVYANRKVSTPLPA